MQGGSLLYQIGKAEGFTILARKKKLRKAQQHITNSFLRKSFILYVVFKKPV